MCVRSVASGRCISLPFWAGVPSERARYGLSVSHWSGEAEILGSNPGYLTFTTLIYDFRLFPCMLIFISISSRPIFIYFSISMWIQADQSYVFISSVCFFPTALVAHIFDSQPLNSFRIYVSYFLCIVDDRKFQSNMTYLCLSKMWIVLIVCKEVILLYLYFDILSFFLSPSLLLNHLRR